MIIFKSKNVDDRALFIDQTRSEEKVVNKGRQLEGDNEKLEVRSITRRLYTSQTCLSSLNNSNILQKQAEKASGGRTKSLGAEIMDGMKEKKVCCSDSRKRASERATRARKRERGRRKIETLALSFLAYPSS